MLNLRHLIQLYMYVVEVCTRLVWESLFLLCLFDGCHCQMGTLGRTDFSCSIRDVDQLDSVDGETYQSLLPQPSVWQFGLIKLLG